MSLASSTAIEPLDLKKTTNIANPIAASAAATVRTTNAKTCPTIKFKWVEILKEHFIKTNYDLGLKKCLNKIDSIIN